MLRWLRGLRRRGAATSAPQSSFLTSVLLDLPKVGAGEDGPALAIQLNNAPIVAVAVFDGLGGSGAQRLATPIGVLTSAAWAAKLAHKITASTISESNEYSHSRSDQATYFSHVLRDKLQEELAHGFVAFGANLEPVSTTVLKGSLSRRLPTTLCLMLVALEHSDARVSAIWAGDSRAYIWRPGTGLAQISRDHTKQPLDAFDAILEDAPMSNFVSADRPFHLELHEIRVEGPFLFFSCTDGVYNYFSSPMEFECQLIAALHQGIDAGDISASIQRCIAGVTNDDASLGLCGVGWTDWAGVRVDLDSRLIVLKGILGSSGALPFADMQDSERPAKAHASLGSSEEDPLVRREIWRAYRGYYESLQPQQKGPSQPRRDDGDPRQ